MVGILNVVDCIYAGAHVSAADENPSGTSGFTPSVTINPSATISLSSQNPEIKITPGKTGTFGYTSTPISVTVHTNTTNNVAVNMKADANTLVSGNNVIQTLPAACDAGCTSSDANFLNRWGYVASSSTLSPAAASYRPVSTNTNIRNYTTQQGSGNTTYVYFGMKLNQATAPGTYTRTLTFETVVTP